MNYLLPTTACVCCKRAFPVYQPTENIKISSYAILETDLLQAHKTVNSGKLGKRVTLKKVLFLLSNEADLNLYNGKFQIFRKCLKIAYQHLLPTLVFLLIQTTEEEFRFLLNEIQKGQLVQNPIYFSNICAYN